MKYVGLQQQIDSNNKKSILLVIAFPLLVIAMTIAVIFFFNFSPEGEPPAFNQVFELAIPVLPTVLGVVAVWFLIAYFSHSAMLNGAAGSHTLSRKENMRVYNLTENLCMSVGMKMPMLRVIESPALNAFASGLNEKSYTVTLTRGIIDKLNDEELEGVIAHELMHIRNKDVRLLVVSIIFVGIFSFVVQIAFRSVLYGGMARGGNRKKDDGKGMIVILVIAAVAYFLSILFKFALSRKREYLADAGAAEMTKNPLALANALRKISNNHHVNDVKSEDVQQMFIENAPEDTSANFLGGVGSLFATHPPIEKRIKVLEQF